MSSISLNIEKTCPWSGARAGIINTPHGAMKTPVFMPVGTQSSVKALTWQQVLDTGTEIVLSNSYHLYLRPGHKLIEAAGGLHKFMSWPYPILTDSGGFQVFSLDELRKISDSGVAFKDHITGNEHFIGPAESMAIQNAIGADIIMAFDDCVKNPATWDEAKAAMDRTHNWLSVCVENHKQKDSQALFGIVQGSTYEDLRKESAKVVTSYDLPGYAIGGVAVGEERSAIEKIVLYTAPLLPEKKPRYLMGIGTPWDILWAVRSGIDMFDCVLPTRLARHGAAFTDNGRIALKNAKYANDFEPLKSDCNCYTCKNHTKAYLHHLVRMKEMTASTLLSIHNIYYLHEQTKGCRDAILEGKFKEYFEEMANKLNTNICQTK